MAFSYETMALAAVALSPQSDHMGDWGDGWWVFMLIMMVLFWTAIIALVIWGVRRLAGPREHTKTPLDIAMERLARGEISEEEFERIERHIT